MNNLNSVLLEGNLIKDPEIKEDYCIFTVATNRYYKENGKYEQEVSFFDVKTAGKLAEQCNEYLKKGRGIRIIGRIKQERWEDEEREYSQVVVMADHVEFKPVYKRLLTDE